MAPYTACSVNWTILGVPQIRKRGSQGYIGGTPNRCPRPTNRGMALTSSDNGSGREMITDEPRVALHLVEMVEQDSNVAS